MPLEQKWPNLSSDERPTSANHDAIMKKIRKADDIINRSLPFVGAALCTTAGVWALSGIAYPTRRSAVLISYLKRTNLLSKLCQSAIGATAVAEILYPESTKDLEKLKEFLKKYSDI